MTTATLKTAVSGVYDLQKLRIQMGNRLVAQFKARLGQTDGKTEEELEEEEKNLLQQLRADYKKITDGVAKLPRPNKFKGTELISEYSELCLVDQYCTIEDSEARQFKMIEKLLDKDPVYKEFLKDVKGAGPALCGILLTEIDFTKCKYVSSLWKYAGFDVVQADNRGRGRYSEHLVEQKYIDSEGKEQTKRGLSYNPVLKTKLFLLGTSFIKCKSPYAQIYYDYKNRMENHERYGKHNDGVRDANDKLITYPGRRHMMAMRYMIKRFLVDLYANAKKILNLPAMPEYSVAKLGLVHGSNPVPPSTPAPQDGGGNVG